MAKAWAGWRLPRKEQGAPSQESRGNSLAASLSLKLLWFDIDIDIGHLLLIFKLEFINVYTHARAHICAHTPIGEIVCAGYGTLGIQKHRKRRSSPPPNPLQNAGGAVRDFWYHL